jgi:hypothetical protein
MRLIGGSRVSEAGQEMGGSNDAEGPTVEWSSDAEIEGCSEKSRKDLRYPQNQWFDFESKDRVKWINVN